MREEIDKHNYVEYSRKELGGRKYIKEVFYNPLCLQWVNFWFQDTHPDRFEELNEKLRGL